MYTVQVYQGHLSGTELKRTLNYSTTVQVQGHEKVQGHKMLKMAKII